MESSNRFSFSLGRRSLVARLVAVLALVACGVAIYLVVMSFTGENGEGEGGNKDKSRSEQAKDEKAATSYTVAAGDTLSEISAATDVPEPRITRLNPDLDAEALTAGQVLALR